MQNNVVNFPGKKLPSVEDDYRHRMRSNLAALAFISLLLLLSCWVIDALLSIPSRIDCNFSVRRPCHVNFSTSTPRSAAVSSDAVADNGSPWVGGEMRFSFGGVQ
jgi:hypothetical protein